MDNRIFWLAIGSFTVGTVGFVFSSLLPLIAVDMRVTVPQAAYLILAFALSYALLGPVLAALLGGLERRTLLVGSLLAFVAGNLVIATSGSLPVLFSGPVLMGAASGLFAATAQATAVSMAGAEHRARAISVVVGGTTFAVALGAPLASLVGTMWGWRGTFFAIAALAVVCSLVFLLRMPKGDRGSRLPLNERLAAAGAPGIGHSLLITLTYLTGCFVIISYLGPIALDGVGLSQLALPGLLLAFGIGAIAGNAASGFLSDRIGALRVIYLSMALATLVSLMIAADIGAVPTRIGQPALFVLMALWGAVGWTFPPAQASRIVGFQPEAAHLTLSLNASAMYLGVALGTLLGGKVLEFGSLADLGLVGALGPIAGLAILYLAGRGRKQIAA